MEIFRSLAVFSVFDPDLYLDQKLEIAKNAGFRQIADFPSIEGKVVLCYSLPPFKADPPFHIFRGFIFLIFEPVEYLRAFQSRQTLNICLDVSVTIFNFSVDLLNGTVLLSNHEVNSV